MGRRPCYSKVEDVNRGAWTANEDLILTNYIHTHGETGWRSLPKQAGLNRSGKSCRLRWLNYLRPDIKRGNISRDEEELIIRMHRLLGNRWALIAGRLPGRTDNEIKNYWNSHLSKTIAMSNGTARNFSSHMPLRKSESLSGMKERSPSSQNSSEDDAVKSCEIRWASDTEVSSGVLAVTDKSVGGKEEAALDVSKSSAQLLEESFVGEEDSRVDERNTILSSQLNLPYPLQFFDPFSLPCIDFGLVEDFSVECLLQPEPHGVEDMRPFENAPNNVDHADCLGMAAEQETAYTLQQRQHCGEQTMQIELDHLFYDEESWEDQVLLTGLSETNEEEYLDILSHIPN